MFDPTFDATSPQYQKPEIDQFDTIQKYVNSLKVDEWLKGDFDAWLMLGLHDLCRLVKQYQMAGIGITNEEKIGLMQINEILTRYGLPCIFE
jgi:hypothetical protein